VITLLFSSTLIAQNIVPLSKGAPAPFDGILLSKEAAADVIVKNEMGDEMCDTKTEYKVGKAVSECELYKGIAETKLETEINKNVELTLLKNGEIDRLNVSLEKSGTNWGPAWFAGGAAVGVAASLIIFFISVQTVKVDIVNQ
jgi:hypothetical protein